MNRALDTLCRDGCLLMVADAPQDTPTCYVVQGTHCTPMNIRSGFGELMFDTGR